MKNILLGFGVCTASMNIFIYFSLHDVLKFHGHVQLAMIAIGFLAIGIGLFLHMYKKTK